MDKDKSARIIASKAVIEREGFYRVKVSSTCTYNAIRAGGAKQVGIVNFAARSILQDAEMTALYKQGMYAEASYVGLSASILEHQFFPRAGTMVDIVVEMKTTSKSLCLQIVKFLKKDSINVTHYEYKRKEKNWNYLYSIMIRGFPSVTEWIKKISSNNPKHIEKLKKMGLL